MREDVADINLAPVEVHRSDESIFVASDVKYNQIAYLVSGWKSKMQFVKTDEVRLLHDFEPAGKGRLAIWMSFPE
jgi:hypothetical protein